MLDPLEFIAYTEKTVTIVEGHNIKCQLYADDTQLYASCFVSCAEQVSSWCASRRLHLNSDNTAHEQTCVKLPTRTSHSVLAATPSIRKK